MSQTSVFKIRNDLIEAYKGYYEDDRDALASAKAFHGVDIITDAQFGEWVKLKIISDTPAERLERYYEWNDIIGYASSLYDIATGRLS